MFQLLLVCCGLGITSTNMLYDKLGTLRCASLHNSPNTDNKIKGIIVARWLKYSYKCSVCHACTLTCMNMKLIRTIDTLGLCQNLLATC